MRLSSKFPVGGFPVSGFPASNIRQGGGPPGFSYWATLTYDETLVGNSESTDIPLFVDITDDNLKLVVNGGPVTDAQGDDICFFTDHTGGTSCVWEVIAYDGSAGRIRAIVAVPSVSDVGGSIVIAVGNDTITTFQGGSGVYDSNFQAVLSMGDGSTLSLTDQGQNGHDGTNHSTTATTGLIYGGANFVAASSQYQSIADASALRITGDLAITLAAKRSTSGKMRLVNKVASNGATNNPYDFGIFNGTPDILYLSQSSSTTNEIVFGSDAVGSSGAWQHLAVQRGRGAFSDTQELFTMAVANAAWQGVATDDTYLYVVSDRDSSFALSNTITKCQMDGTVVQTLTNAYDPGLSDFYSFGDAQIIGGSLYVGAYNVNDPGHGTLMSRVAVFDPSDLSFVEDFDLGTNVSVCEGVDFHDGSFWCIDGGTDVYSVKQFDDEFNFVDDWTLTPATTLPAFPTGVFTYQGIKFKGDLMFVNLHGENTAGVHYAYGCDVYEYTGSAFVFRHRFVPPAEGTGQGFDFASDGVTTYWADRIRNSIWKTTYVGPANGEAGNNRQITFFIDGVPQSLMFQTVTAPSADTSQVNIGRRPDGGSFFNGVLDEVRLSDSSLRTGAWITATANNMLSPTTFWSLGPWKVG